MLDGLKLFFLTEIKAENVQKSEKIGNFFLRPAQYLWKGKKIDFVQSGTDFASQHALIYESKRSWLKVVLAVIALAPATIIGTIFKGYAVVKYHNAQHTAQFKACLNSAPNQFIANDPKFANSLTSLIEELQKDPTLQTRFISEMTKVSFQPIYTEMIENGETIPEFNYTVKENNQNILDQIHLLWNVSVLDVQDHYDGQIPCNSVGEQGVQSFIGRRALKPRIQFTDSQGYIATEAADVFYSRTTKL